MNANENKWYRKALNLSVITIFFTLLEGLASLVMGAKGETLTLFGFGLDSLIEVISGVGIFIMVRRIQKNQTNNRSKAEIMALRITGISLFSLSGVLLLGAIFSIIQNHRPETTIWGIIISLISILGMAWLVWRKTKVGKLLKSAPIIADANCSKICIYMSVVVLLSSLIFAATGNGYIDSIGTLALAYFSFVEGKESIEKSKNLNADSCC